MQDRVPTRRVGESEKRRPSEESIERCYKIGLDELARLLDISEPATLGRTAEIGKDGELVIWYRGTIRG